MANSKSILITLYSHPGYYPPTLNLIRCTASRFDEVTILSRNFLQADWKFPANVKVIEVGPLMSIRESEQLPLHQKIYYFIQYSLALGRELSAKSYKWLVLCDPIPTLSFRILRPFLSKGTKVWYHNHDVSELKAHRLFSIGWFAYFSEKSIFGKLNLFTLPANERKVYFPIHKLRGKYAFLPNYPSFLHYSQYSRAQEFTKPIRILFQGSIGPGHGFEEILRTIAIHKEIKAWKLVMVGKGEDDYLNQLNSLINDLGIADSFEWNGFVPYMDLPYITVSCQIGIGIYTGMDVMNQTVGTASNKIYEYAAMGLPVLVHDSPYWRNLLGKFDWCFFTDLSQESLTQTIHQITLDYSRYSQSAQSSFQNHLNFEKYFEQILPILES